MLRIAAAASRSHAAARPAAWRSATATACSASPVVRTLHSLARCGTSGQLLTVCARVTAAAGVPSPPRPLLLLRGGLDSPRRSLFGFGKPERVTLKERRRVPFPASVYFDVVLNVDEYHEFVPFCSASRVTKRLGPNQMEADLTIGFRVFTEAYTSRIDYERPKTIRIKSVQSSVFGHLISTWAFKPDPQDPQQCFVEFDIDFEVSSPVHASAVKLFFTDVAERQIKAFSERCIKLYREGKVKADIPAQSTQKTGTKAAGQNTQAAQPQPSPPTSVPATSGSTPSRKAAPVASPPPSPPVSAAAASRPTPAKASVPTPPAPAFGVSPESLVSSAPSSSLSCPVTHVGHRIKFSPSEIAKLQAVFRRHAKPVRTRQTSEGDAPTPPPAATAAATSHEHEYDPDRFGEGVTASTGAFSPPEHVYASDGTELRLFVDGFVGLCQDVCMSTGGVFGRFRERATVRAVSDIGAEGLLSHALFVGDPQVYASGADTSSSDAPPFDRATPYLHLPHTDPEAVVSSSKSPARRSVPHSFGFGEFLSHFYYLTKATIEEKLQYALLLTAHRMHLYGADCYHPSHGSSVTSSPVPDVFNGRHSSALSVPSLRSATAAFFCQQLGVLRHIMPLMSYHRAREMREQLQQQREAIQQRVAARKQSPNADLLPPLPDEVSANALPVDPGVTALALLGLLEGVLSEAETAVSEAIEKMSDDVEQKQTHVQTPAVPVPVEQWVSQWSTQAELLTLVSVPGLATLIQIHSVVPLEVYDATGATRTQAKAAKTPLRSA